MRLVDADDAKLYLNESAVEQMKRMKTIDPIHAAGGCYCRECAYFVCDFGGMCALTDANVRENDFCSTGDKKNNKIMFCEGWGEIEEEQK